MDANGGLSFDWDLKKRTNDSAFIVNQWSVVDSGGSNKTKWPDSIEMCTNTIDAKAERRRKVIASIPLFHWLVRPCLWFGSTVARINAAVMSPFCFILHGVCYLISISGNFPLPYNNEPIRRINKRHAPPFRLLLIYSAKKNKKNVGGNQQWNLLCKTDPICQNKHIHMNPIPSCSIEIQSRLLFEFNWKIILFIESVFLKQAKQKLEKTSSNRCSFTFWIFGFFFFLVLME